MARKVVRVRQMKEGSESTAPCMHQQVAVVGPQDLIVGREVALVGDGEVFVSRQVAIIGQDEIFVGQQVALLGEQVTLFGRLMGSRAKLDSDARKSGKGERSK